MNDQQHKEIIILAMSAALLKFCKENDLPFMSADELSMRKDITDFQFGWLVGYSRVWDSLIN